MLKTTRRGLKMSCHHKKTPLLNEMDYAWLIALSILFVMIIFAYIYNRRNLTVRENTN